MELVSSRLLSCCIAFVIFVVPLARSTEHINGKILTGHKKSQLLINKVTLTQKGYIQFLRYIAEVPTIHDFTFCIWLRSHNLTYSHPLVSYSLHEETRLIRAWISPHGKTANLAIREHLVFKVPVNLKENHWNHICESWESKTGAWNFFLNGKLKASGHEPKLQGITIPPKGDLVVGQEYTDFDKGLDDGIEGDIFGFNFILAPATINYEVPYKERDYILPRPNFNNGYNTIISETTENSQYTQDIYGTNPPEYKEDKEETPVPSALGYFSSMQANRDPKSMFGYFKSPNTYGKMRYYYPNNYNKMPSNYNQNNMMYSGTMMSPSYNMNAMSHRRNIWPFSYRGGANRRVYVPPKLFLNDINGGVTNKPLGLVLVELGYQNCALGRGAPLDDEKVLVSWTKTPVRVFGGAILKSIPPFCL